LFYDWFVDLCYQLLQCSQWLLSAWGLEWIATTWTMMWQWVLQLILRKLYRISTYCEMKQKWTNSSRFISARKNIRFCAHRQGDATHEWIWSDQTILKIKVLGLQSGYNQLIFFCISKMGLFLFNFWQFLQGTRHK
jgi:hypothetical protein